MCHPACPFLGRRGGGFFRRYVITSSFRLNLQKESKIMGNMQRTIILLLRKGAPVVMNTLLNATNPSQSAYIPMETVAMHQQWKDMTATASRMKAARWCIRKAVAMWRL